MFYSARIDKLKAHIRDTGVPLCPNSYEPLFTCVNSNMWMPAETEDNVISLCVYEFKLVAEVGRRAKEPERSLWRNQV